MELIMGKFLKGNKVNLGRKMPENVRAALLQANIGHKPWNKGIPWSSEVKEKFRRAKIGKPSNQPIGYIHSPEVRKKMSESGKGKHTGSKGSGWKDGRSLVLGYKSWSKNRRNRVVHRMKREGKTHSFLEWESLKRLYGNKCLCCEKKEPEIRLTVDHVIPLSRGGDDSIENVQPLCLHCNLKKSTKSISFKDAPIVGGEEAKTRN